jgi:cell division protein FtsW (lipid II flippase)
LERTGALRGFSVSLLVIPSIPIVICTAVGSRAADYGDRFSSLRANALLVMMLAAGLVAFGAFPLGDVRTVTDYGTAMLVLAAVLAGTLAVRLPRHVAALWSATVIGALAVVLITSTRPRERLTLLVQTHLAIADRDAAFSNERRDANALPTEQAVAVARALLSGGWSGVGSSSIPLWVIPRASDDLIFSALVHRGGLIGMLALLGSLWVFFEAVRRLASATVVSEDRAVVWATASLILLPLAYGALVALGVMPISGVAFPFWAMSSSSGIASALLVGTLLAFSEDHQE